jgi:hypothetical protein
MLGLRPQDQDTAPGATSPAGFATRAEKRFGHAHSSSKARRPSEVYNTVPWRDCECGAQGIPCPECNASDPPKMPPGFKQSRGLLLAHIGSCTVLSMKFSALDEI